MSFVADGLLNNGDSPLRSLSIGNNSVRCGGVTDLSHALARGCGAPLLALHLEDNPGVGDRGAAALASALASEQCMLGELLVRNCGIGDLGARAMCEAVPLANALRRLTLSHGGITDLSLFTSTLSTLSVLRLSDNPGILRVPTDFADAGASSSTLRELDLSGSSSAFARKSLIRA